MDQSEFFQARILSLTQAKSRLEDKILRTVEAQVIVAYTGTQREMVPAPSLCHLKHNSIQEKSYEKMKFEGYLRDLEIQIYRCISKACSLSKFIFKQHRKIEIKY